MSNLPHPITGLPCSIHFSKYSEGGCLNTQFWPKWSKPTKIRNKMCACYGAVELCYYSSYEWICYTDLIVRFVAVVRIWLFEQQIWWFFDFSCVFHDQVGQFQFFIPEVLVILFAWLYWMGIYSIWYSSYLKQEVLSTLSDYIIVVYTDFG